LIVLVATEIAEAIANPQHITVSPSIPQVHARQAWAHDISTGWTAVASSRPVVLRTEQVAYLVSDQRGGGLEIASDTDDGNRPCAADGANSGQTLHIHGLSGDHQKNIMGG
jgi:hypothetical protein